MINTDRIVPVTETDLLTLYGNVLTIAGETVDAVQATSPGVFEIESAANDLIAAEPVASMDFASGVETATVYFIAGYDYKGFTIDGEAATVTGDVTADGSTLYKAELANSAITVSKIRF